MITDSFKVQKRKFLDPQSTASPPKRAKDATALSNLPQAPVFRPTMEEFRNPFAYIRSISGQARKSGVCRVIPPEGWQLPEWQANMQKHQSQFDKPPTFETNQQPLHGLQQAEGYASGDNYTFASYKEKAEQHRKEYLESKELPEDVSLEELEKIYWSVVDQKLNPPEKYTVDYGNDVSSQSFGSGFAKDKTPWNLRSFARHPNSVLRFLDTDIDGVTHPWLYTGQLFTTFCWHAEDQFLYSIFFQHAGHPRQWYGAPASDAEKLVTAMRKHFPGLFEKEPDLETKLVTMINPAILCQEGVNVHRCLQEPGSFVITFPKGYHSGFSYGWSFGEAVNFATPEWFPFGRMCRKRDRKFERRPCFSQDKLLMHTAFGLLKHTTGISDIVRAELVKMFRVERKLRREAERYLRIRKTKHIDRSCDVSADGKDLSYCHICGDGLYHSWLECSACGRNLDPEKPTRVCLRCMDFLCLVPDDTTERGYRPEPCGSKYTTLYYRYSVDQLCKFIERVCGVSFS